MLVHNEEAAHAGDGGGRNFPASFSKLTEAPRSDLFPGVGFGIAASVLVALPADVGHVRLGDGVAQAVVVGQGW